MRTLTGIVCSTVIGTALFATTAKAVVLQDLLDGATLTVGDKIFSDWSYVTICGPDATAITVNGLTHNDLLHGIGIFGEFSAVRDVCSAAISYKVTALSPQWIERIGLSYTLSASGNGGTIEIGETVWKDGFGLGVPVGQASVSFSDMSDPPPEPILQGDDLTWAPSYLEAVYVTKTISLAAADAGSAVGADAIYQNFYQVPEPAHTALALLAVSALGGIVIRRRRG